MLHGSIVDGAKQHCWRFSTRRCASPMLPGRQGGEMVFQSAASARNRLEAALSRLQDNGSNAFTRLYSDSASIEADAADKRKSGGKSLGPLDGRIVSIKDLFDVAGEPTLAGSVIQRTAPQAHADALVVGR